jgi:hypothetical protein
VFLLSGRIIKVLNGHNGFKTGDMMNNMRVELGKSSLGNAFIPYCCLDFNG